MLKKFIFIFMIGVSSAHQKAELNILFVDDSSIFRKTYKKIRDKINNDPKCSYFINPDDRFICAWGHEALRIYKNSFEREEPIHLTLLDLNMCELYMDEVPQYKKAGEEVAKYLRGRDDSLFNYSIIKIEEKDCYLSSYEFSTNPVIFENSIVGATDESNDYEDLYGVFTEINGKITDSKILNDLILRHVDCFSCEKKTLKMLVDIESDNPFPDPLDQTMFLLEKSLVSLQSNNRNQEFFCDNEFLLNNEIFELEKQIKDYVEENAADYVLPSKSLK